MKDIYNLVIKTFTRGSKIPLLRNEKYDTFIEVTTTKINGVFHRKAIQYGISDLNKKKITSEFIELTFEYFVKNNKSFPKREWYKNHCKLKHEYKSRPCNYSIVQGLILVTLNLNKL